MRTETTLHIVFKFKVDRTRFHEGEASANFGGKVELKDKEERFAIRLACLCLQQGTIN